MIERRYYGEFGGAYLPEILVSTFEELAAAFQEAKEDPGFWEEYKDFMSTYSCRPTPLTFAENLTEYFGGPRMYIKREDLNHTGAHKINNVMGQGLLVKRMGKTPRDRRDRRRSARRGHGHHGRQIRIQLHHLYGRAGRCPAAAQCVLDGTPGCAGRAGSRRLPDIKRCHQCGLA